MILFDQIVKIQALPVHICVLFYFSAYSSELETLQNKKARLLTEQAFIHMLPDKDYNMILFDQIVKIQALPLRVCVLFYFSAYSSELETLQNKKARLLTEQAFIHMLPDKDYNMILFDQIVKIQALPVRICVLFYFSAYSSELETLQNKKARLLTERAFIHMLPDKDYNMILFDQIVKIQALPVRICVLFYFSAYSSELETLQNKKARLLTERAFIHMLPDKDSNQETSRSDRNVLPVTPSGNVGANV